MRLSEFWTRMDVAFGPAYAPSLARDHVVAQLGGRTVIEALDSGEDTKTVWRAVCEAFDLPPKQR